VSLCPCLGYFWSIDLKIDCSFAALNGTERILAPVASKIAFEIAEGTTAAVGSPAPHGFSVGRSINSMTISGSSGNDEIGFESHEARAIRRTSNMRRRCADAPDVEANLQSRRCRN
jgi:hypothetical protein